MKQLCMFLIQACVLSSSVCGAVQSAKARDGAFYWNAKIGRGINFGNALEAPNEGDWSVRLEKSYFDLVADAGFDSVRIPIRWSAHAARETPYTIDPAFLARINWAVDQALSRDLVVIINIHHYREFMDVPLEHRDRFLGIWKQIAEHYRGYPPELFFEVMNEPNKNVTAELWNELQNEAVGLIRKTNPDRTILVAPIGWNRINRLKDLKLPFNDGNLIASVHFYEPFDFTHQGAGWVGRDIPVGTAWKGTADEEAAVGADLEEAERWSKENNIPINIGEFGAYHKADLSSRARWNTFVRSEAEKRKMSWNYWEFCSGFGVYDPTEKAWRKELLKSLIPE